MYGVVNARLFNSCFGTYSNIIKLVKGEIIKIAFLMDVLIINMNMKTNRLVTENKLLDLLKYISTLMIIISHCLPVIRSELLNIFYGQWMFRFAVPLFFLSSGYYYTIFDDEMKKKYIVRIFSLYILSTIIYAPLFLRDGVDFILKSIFFGYSHLWYLSALVLGLCLMYVIEKLACFNKIYLCVSLLLILIGAFFDEYYKMFGMPCLDKAYACLQFVGGVRHGIFFALPMLMFGKFLAENKAKFLFNPKKSFVFVGIVSLLSLIEFCFLFSVIGINIKCDITFFNWLPAIALFVLTLNYCPKILHGVYTKPFRKMADVIYIIHMWIIAVVIKFFGLNYEIKCLVIILISVAVGYVYINVYNESKKHRMNNKTNMH